MSDKPTRRYVYVPQLSKEQTSRLGSQAIAVLYGICLARRNGTDLAEIGTRLLTENAGLSHARYTRCGLAKLIDAGIVRVETAGSRGAGKRPTYRIDFSPTTDPTEAAFQPEINESNCTHLDEKNGSNRTHLNGSDCTHFDAANGSNSTHLNGYNPTPGLRTTAKDNTSAGAGDGETPKLDKPLTEYFDAAFRRVRGKKYHHRGGADAKAVKAILAAASNDLPTAQRMVDKYLADNDAFTAKNGYTLAFMQTKLNALTPAQPRALATTAGAFRHKDD